MNHKRIPTTMGLLSLLVLNFLFTSCMGQEKKTYWKTANVTKVDGNRMTGITLAYMEALAMQHIHLAKAQDTLIFFYPNKKQVPIPEFESLTGYRSGATDESTNPREAFEATLRYAAEQSVRCLAPLYQSDSPLMAYRDIGGVHFIVLDNSAYEILPAQLAFNKKVNEHTTPC